MHHEHGDIVHEDLDDGVVNNKGEVEHLARRGRGVLPGKDQLEAELCDLGLGAICEGEEHMRGAWSAAGALLPVCVGELTGRDQRAVLALDDNRLKLWVEVDVRPLLGACAHAEPGLGEVGITPHECKGHLDDIVRCHGLPRERHVPGAAIERLWCGGRDRRLLPVGVQDLRHNLLAELMRRRSEGVSVYVGDRCGGGLR